jgi:hypothetical protein
MSVLHVTKKIMQALDDSVISWEQRSIGNMGAIKCPLCEAARDLASKNMTIGHVCQPCPIYVDNAFERVCGSISSLNGTYHNAKSTEERKECASEMFSYLLDLRNRCYVMIETEEKRTCDNCGLSTHHCPLQDGCRTYVKNNIFQKNDYWRPINCPVIVPLGSVDKNKNMISPNIKISCYNLVEGCNEIKSLQSTIETMQLYVKTLERRLSNTELLECMQTRKLYHDALDLFEYKRRNNGNKSND